MKLTWKQIDPFVKSPDKKARAILVYGPDDGLMRERAKAMGLTVVKDLADPFNVTVLNEQILLDDPARLIDEALSMSMMGGAKLIRVEGASDKISPVFHAYLENPSLDNVVIVEAGELSPKSPLRALFEKSPHAAALPCYVEDEKSVAQVIRDMAKAGGFSLQSDAAMWLATNLAGDRGRIRSEMEKLLVYMGTQGGTIKLEDAQSACGEAGAQSFDDLIYAVGGGKTETALTTYKKLLDESVPVVAILRSLQTHFRKLHFVHALMHEGMDSESAMKKLSPPIFFKYESSFRSHLSRWPMGKLNDVLKRLADVEAQTKRTGTPSETLTAQAILSLSKSA
ncbi:MAG: DNA polymerase III subunit delta [Alphaproteobacteria bacterium]|nr:DNA polymerase III subunit delta [Alphaproteobacteria bacterium]